MFIADLCVIITLTGYKPNIHQQMNVNINCGTSVQWNTTQKLKIYIYTIGTHSFDIFNIKISKSSH